MAKYYTTTLQKGSKGNEVKEWQNFLNTQGYNLSVDGDFGDKTYAATVEWQGKNGLGADGIVGANTWGKAGYTDYATISTPAATPTNPTYDSTLWKDTTEGQGAWDAYETALGNYNTASKTPFTFSEAEWQKTVEDNLKNFKDFSYDLNGDALYQQYKDKYIQQGKLAMGDAIGQASAMTGGYGNSYAQSVGQQAYQGQLDNLNDIVPELYSMALDRYKMEKDDLYTQASYLMQKYEQEYGKYSDEYQRILDALGIANDNYYNGADMFYTEQNNKNGVLGQTFNDEMAIWEANEGVRQDALNRAELASNTVSGNVTGNVDSTGTPYKGTTPSGVNYDNGSLDKEKVKTIQQALGISADGYWGPKSTQAAGGLTADEAWNAYQSGKLGQKDPQPQQSNNTTQFINRLPTKAEYLARDNSEDEWFKYVEDKITQFVRDERITDEEALYLIEYYKIP